MADIGAIPTKTTVRITSTTGDFGTISAATESAAGVMTANHVKSLNQVLAWGMLNGLAPAEPADTSNLARRDEVAAALRVVAEHHTPQIEKLMGEIAALRSRPAGDASGHEQIIIETLETVAHLASRNTELERRIALIESALADIGQANMRLSATA